MNGIRTLPIRLDPLPGEALDSWLEAIAARLDSPLLHMLPAFSLDAETTERSRRGGPPPNWTICLQPEELDALATATQVDPATLRAMTLETYADNAIVIDMPRREVNRTQLWGRGGGSRYCPDCLTATGGRWQLSWRLSWAFACLTHRRLLANICPTCGKAPRTRVHSLTHVPQLGRCARPSPSSESKGPGTTRCGGSLLETEPSA
ncbi:TniQ family protein [Microbispora sp. NPDC049125]|uniref:TniQ family protein n=1 Tax=Microbispora sp. NPDC049125 TaxID=3154929 RepID=UPI0034667F4D